MMVYSLAMIVRYKHRITGMMLTIKKKYNNIAICSVRKSDIEIIYNNIKIDTVICNIDNLILIK